MHAAAITPARLWQIAVPMTAAMLGAMAGMAPEFAVAAAIGLLIGALILNDLALGLCLFATISFLEVIPGLEGVPLAKLTGGLLAFSWLATTSARSGPRRELLNNHPGAAAAIALLLAWAAASALWSKVPADAVDSALRWGLNLVLFPVVYAAIRRPQHVRWLFAAFVVGALLAALMSLMFPSGGGEAAEGARLSGAGVNPNQLGGSLLVAVILGGALGTCRELGNGARMLAFSLSGLALIFLVMTVSRGAMLGLAVALLLAPLLSGRGRHTLATVLVATALLSGAAYAVALAPESTIERVTRAGDAGSGRTDIWKVGLRMVAAEPLHGVGAGNYANTAVHYLLEPGALLRDEFIVDKPKVAHNIFLHVLAELGAIGLTLFLAIIGFSIAAMVRAARAFARTGERSLELLSRSLVVAVCGLLVAGFFSSDLFSKQLWLLLATGPALLGLAADRARALP